MSDMAPSCSGGDSSGLHADWSAAHVLAVSARACLAYGMMREIDGGVVTVLLAARPECHLDLQTLSGASAAKISRLLRRLREMGGAVRLKPIITAAHPAAVYEVLTPSGMDRVGELVDRLRSRLDPVGSFQNGDQSDLQQAVARREAMQIAWAQRQYGDVWRDWPDAPNAVRRPFQEGSAGPLDPALSPSANIAIHRSWAEEASRCSWLRLAYLAALVGRSCAIGDPVGRAAVLRQAGMLAPDASALELSAALGIGRSHAFRLRRAGPTTGTEATEILAAVRALLSPFSLRTMADVRGELLAVRSKLGSGYEDPSQYCPVRSMHAADWRRVFAGLPRAKQKMWTKLASAAMASLGRAMGPRSRRRRLLPK